MFETFQAENMPKQNFKINNPDVTIILMLIILIIHLFQKIPLYGFIPVSSLDHDVPHNSCEGEKKEYFSHYSNFQISVGVCYEVR